jgi:hypothetical protein
LWGSGGEREGERERRTRKGKREEPGRGMEVIGKEEVRWVREAQ